MTSVLDESSETGIDPAAASTAPINQRMASFCASTSGEISSTFRSR